MWTIKATSERKNELIEDDLLGFPFSETTGILGNGWQEHNLKRPVFVQLLWNCIHFWNHGEDFQHLFLSYLLICL